MRNREKLREAGKWIFVLLWALLFLGCFFRQDIYAVAARYASLVAFAGFCVLFFTHDSLKACFLRRDREFFLMAAADVLALVNLFVIHSNKGALLTVVNLLFVVYLAGRVDFSGRQMEVLTGFATLFLIPWFAFVKWEYNFNMAGLVFMTITILGILFLELLRERTGLLYLRWVAVLLYATGTLYTVLYHARCAMVGMSAFGIFLAGGKLLQKYKPLHRVLIIAATAGSIAFTIFYVWLGSRSFDLTFLYKSILSGREEIWKELWQALFSQPITGIGSSYEMKSFFIFEVHNGLFDILAVHGIPVFLVVIGLLVKRLWSFSAIPQRTPAGRVALAGMFAILFTSFFENFFIVPPYLLVFFVLLTGIRTAGKAERLYTDG